MNSPKLQETKGWRLSPACYTRAGEIGWKIQSHKKNSHPERLVFLSNPLFLLLPFLFLCLFLFPFLFRSFCFPNRFFFMFSLFLLLIVCLFIHASLFVCHCMLSFPLYLELSSLLSSYLLFCICLNCGFAFSTSYLVVYIIYMCVFVVSY